MNFWGWAVQVVLQVVTCPCQNTQGNSDHWLQVHPSLIHCQIAGGGMLVSDASTYQYWWWWCWWWCGWWWWYWCKLYWRVAVCISGRVLWLRGQRPLGSESYFQPWWPVDVIQGEFGIVLFHLYMLHLSSLDGLHCCCSWQTVSSVVPSAEYRITRHMGAMLHNISWVKVASVFVSDIAIFVLKRDVKLQLTNCGICAPTISLCRVVSFIFPLQTLHIH